MWNLSLVSNQVTSFQGRVNYFPGKRSWGELTCHEFERWTWIAFYYLWGIHGSDTLNSFSKIQIWWRRAVPKLGDPGSGRGTLCHWPGEARLGGVGRTQSSLTDLILSSVLWKEWLVHGRNWIESVQVVEERSLWRSSKARVYRGGHPEREAECRRGVGRRAAYELRAEGGGRRLPSSCFVADRPDFPVTALQWKSIISREPCFSKTFTLF